MQPLSPRRERGPCVVADISDAYRDHMADVQRYLFARTHDPQRAADLTQDVFVDALRALPRLERRGNSLLPWLLTVARRRLADDVRTRAAEPAYEQLDEARGVADHLDDDALEAAELLQIVARLPENQRAVVLLRAVVGCSFTEIGRVRAMRPSACRMQYSRALRALRR